MVFSLQLPKHRPVIALADKVEVSVKRSDFASSKEAFEKLSALNAGWKDSLRDMDTAADSAKITEQFKVGINEAFERSI